MNIPKIRYMCEAYEEIKKADPETVITYNRFRKDVKEGLIPSRMNGRHFLIDLKNVEEYVNNFGHMGMEVSAGAMRQIKE